MPNTFKYHSFISQFADCPPVQCKEINMIVFRFIFEDRNHQDNFRPVLLIKPTRINDKSFDTDEMKCSGYSLSMFDLLTNARNVFVRLLQRNKNIGKTIGDHVAEISIKPDDGRATEPSIGESDWGHFDFFEYLNTKFLDKIIQVEKLII